ncbi:MAG: hypothetical protein ABI231_06230 [Candidatus Tumulicola sp.]
MMLSEELIAKIGNGLDLMPPKPASRLELDLLLGKIETQIRAAQERGATYAEISAQISESGYPIKCSTLRTALQRRRKAGAVVTRQGKRIDAKRRAATVVKNASPPPSSAKR